MSLRRLLHVVGPESLEGFALTRRWSRLLRELRPDVAQHVALIGLADHPEAAAFRDEVRSAGGQAVELRMPLTVGGVLVRRQLQELRRAAVPDVIHAHSFKAGVLTRLQIGRRQDQPPVLYSPHGYPGLPLTEKKTLRSRLHRKLERQAGNAPGCWTLCGSEYEKLFARKRLKLSASRLLVQRPGIDTNLFQPARQETERMALRRELGLPEKAVIVLTFAAGTGRAAATARALAELGETPSPRPLCLVQVGAGAAELREKMSAPQRDQHVVMETCAAPEKLLRAADAYLQISVGDMLPPGVMQAVATGLPLILARLPELQDYGNFPLAVRWIEPDESPRIFGDNIAAALREATSLSGLITWEQRAAALRFFEERAEFAKLVALYRALAEGRDPASP